MNVIASKRGYFGRLIEAGETFEVPDGARASWFAPEGGYAPEPESPETPIAPASSAAPGRGRKKAAAPAPEEPAPG